MTTILMLLLLQLPGCEWCGVSEAPNRLKHEVTIAGPAEPGQRLRITGRVLRRGKPAPGVILYLYHTNARGIYPKRGDEQGNARRHGYLRGWLRTDAQGRYAIHTIRPGTYPSRTDPAHIHVVVGERGGETSIDDFVFDDDPLVNASYRARVQNRGGSGIVRLRREEGIWIGRRDIHLP